MRQGLGHGYAMGAVTGVTTIGFPSWTSGLAYLIARVVVQKPAQKYRRATKSVWWSVRRAPYHSRFMRARKERNRFQQKRSPRSEHYSMPIYTFRATQCHVRVNFSTDTYNYCYPVEISTNRRWNAWWLIHRGKINTEPINSNIIMTFYIRF